MGNLTHLEMRLVELDLSYQAEMKSTPAGREANELLREAQELEHQARLDEALALRQQAVTLFSDDDDSAAASSARHDLAHSLIPNPRHGLFKGQLLADQQACISAMELLRQALRAPVRQRVPMRRAQSENSLAVCLRMLAGLVTEPKREELLQEVEQLYRSVIPLSEKCGRLGFRLVAEAHLNYGNLLLEREAEAQALQQYDWAIGAAHRAQRDGYGSMRHVLARARISAAGILVRRGRKKDLTKAEQYAKEALKEPELGREDQALLVLAEIELAGEAPDCNERVRKFLSKVRSTRLADDRLRIVYIQLLRRTGAVDDALAVLKEWIDNSIHLRAQTIADFAADTAAMDFQLAASLAARILVEDKADAVGAFLQLENTSGMRFAEDFSVFLWRPREPVTRALQSKMEHHSGRASVLDSMLRSMETLAPESQRERLREILEAYRVAPDDEEGVRGMPDKAFYVETLRAAVNAPVPLHHLEGNLAKERTRCIKLKSALRRHDATYGARSHPLEEDLSREKLEALLREHPEQVLMRLSLHQELLVVSTWIEGEQVVARSTSIAIPSRLRDLLREVAQDKKELDYTELTGLLASVDLTAALPTRRYARAVLLPSHAAAALPLAALGPQGHRLMDRFESLIWLPSLLPLRSWPAAMKPRSGNLVVNPLNTTFHSIALPLHMDGERRLEGKDATPEALTHMAAEVATVCIYTHGLHEPGDEPVLELHDKQQLSASHLMGKLAGLERMEIWACQTGTNRAIDPFTPPVDEGFGLDFLLLSRGVRTVIGTLWSVPDLVTASIVRRYRQRLSEGTNPSVALLEAQRWWQEEGLDLLLEQLRCAPPGQAVATFAAKLGVELAPATLDSAARMLGPASRSQDVEKVRAAFSCPVSWAALRFVGAPERGPREPWVEVPERLLTKEEEQVVAQCLEVEATETAEPEDFREQQESWLTAYAMLKPGESPSVEQALQMARLLRDRLIGSHQDNLLVALAWIHEALATPELAESDRVRLSVEAAHLWLEVAIFEQWLPLLPQRTAVARAQQFLERLPPAGELVAADILAARARMHLLLHAYDADEPLRCVQQAWELISPALEQLQPGSYEALRVATIAVELLPRAEAGLAPQRERALQRVRVLAEQVRHPQWMFPAWQRLRGALDRFEPDDGNAQRAQHLSTPRELQEATVHAVGREAQRPGFSSIATLKLLSAALSQMESGLWGYPSDERRNLVRTTGTQGAAYRSLMKSYLSNHIRNEPEGGAHQLACLQYACDLRLTFLGRLAWVSTWLPDLLGSRFRKLQEFIRNRQSLSAAVADTALLKTSPGDDNPYHMDPYALPARAMSPGLKDFRGLSAWSLELLCGVWPEHVKPARTAAFEAVRTLNMLEHEARHLWREALDMDARMRKEASGDDRVSLAQMMNPALKLEDNEEWLGSLAEGYGLLGLVLGQQGELFIIAWWNSGAGPTGRTVRLSSTAVQDALVQLLRPAREDVSPQRGSSSPRREAWSRLEAALSPALTSLLQEAQKKRSLRWWVLAPGAMRALPLLGLRLEDGALLAEKVLRLSHLPALRFGMLGSSLLKEVEPFTACVVSPESRQGTTCFGEAAQQTLHGVYPPELVLEAGKVHGQQGDVVELLASHASRIRTLRLYGVGTPESITDTTGGLRLGPGHALMDRNTLGLFLPHCRLVELWACTSGGTDIERVVRDHGDRLPGLVQGFLASGAVAVLDLAWPVHDVVKALVCEQYGWRSRRTGHGPEILAESIEHVALLLRELPALPASTPRREVLAAIDEMRRIQAEHVLGRSPALARFEAHANSPAMANLSGTELIDELCQPVHLGAFRWWGE
ncbi:CHAT domain-containing protein [Corallococcus sp. BB11-1]|uniref:CHAT domain-containing protein n=1 Tax=Corallococcus sp. BB11-1 TaxID=2996783 RepID=UPI002271FD96|nr:CHAT domain-containing protein [Corallococcus sp. BB11-1]MCY1031459.1 CHAT domain-containing protein [Corallococcus sp. BB11-1]